MKRLLIHIGYPKTATTTLQNGLFDELHNANIVNYLRTGKDLSGVHVLKDYLFHDKKIDFYPMLLEDRLNVMSREGFTMQKLHWEKKFSLKIDNCAFPQKIASLFCDSVEDLKIMVTIRNQQSFIYSHYAQAYKRFVNDPELYTFDKYLKKVVWDDEYRYIYNYSDVLSDYADCFGKKNVHVLLFEDLANDRNYFFTQLSKILNIDVQIISEFLDNKHLNKKKKNEDGTVVKVKKNNIIQGVYSNPYIRNNFKRFFKKAFRNGGRMEGYLKNAINAGSRRRHLIPYPTSTQKNDVFKKFRDNNLKLAEDFNVAKEKLKRYGYI